MNKAAIQRFEKYVMPEPNTGCWLWAGYVAPTHGYGSFTISTGRTTSAHRASYIIHKGIPPKGLFILHSCDVRICVNPDHLFLGTHQDNMRDMVLKGRNFKFRSQECHLTKLTENDVIEIRKLSASGVPTKELATKFSVTPENINSIKRKATWKNF